MTQAAIVEVAVLGPVTAKRGVHAVPLGGPKDRGVLAQLALAGTRPVGEAAIIDGIWGEEPPLRAGKAVQNQVLRLRRAMRTVTDAPVILTERGGYRLAPTLCASDLDRAQSLIDRARAMAATSRSDEASSLLAEALEEWRGEPLADVIGLPFATVAATRLNELRLVALEERIEADLACGRHQRLVAELYQAVHNAPLRECLWGQLMVALYRSGRQAEALRVFQQLRHQLDQDLGLAPGGELVAIERAIAAGTLPTRPAPLRPVSSAPVDHLVDAQRLLADVIAPTHVDRGDIVTREGDPGDTAYIIVSGEAEVTIEGRTVATVGPGEIVGEMALLDGSPRVATVAASTPMRLIAIPQDLFGALLEERSVAARLLATVVGRLRAVESAAFRAG